MAGLALLLAFLFNAIGRGFGDTYLVFILPLESEFGWNRSEISSVYSMYMLSTGLSAPLIGMLFDRWGPRLVYAAGLCCLGLAYTLASKLEQLWQFHLYIGIAGGFGVTALGMVPAAVLISRWFRNNRSTVIGIAYAGFGCGTLLLVPLAQYLNVSVGWRATYHLLGISLLILLPIVLLLPWHRLRAGPRDAPHYPFPAGSPDEDSRPAAHTLKSALRAPAFWRLAQAFFFTGMAMYTILVQTVAFLIEAGFTPLKAAGAFGVAGMLSVVGVVTSGTFADRIGYRRTVTASFVSTFLGLLALLALSFAPSDWLLVVFVALFGIAQGARGPIISALCATFFPGAGSVYGTVYASMSIGAGAGSLMSGVLHDLTGGYQASFVFSMLAILLAAMPFWRSTAFNSFARY